MLIEVLIEMFLPSGNPLPALPTASYATGILDRNRHVISPSLRLRKSFANSGGVQKNSTSKQLKFESMTYLTNVRIEIKIFPLQSIKHVLMSHSFARNI